MLLIFRDEKMSDGLKFRLRIIQLVESMLEKYTVGDMDEMDRFEMDQVQMCINLLLLMVEICQVMAETQIFEKYLFHLVISMHMFVP